MQKGDKYNRWTVLKVISSEMVFCHCSCGTKKNVSKYTLIAGTSKSCGCYLKEHSGLYCRTHGMYGTRTYHIWNAMIQRCNNKNNISYKNYGGRGITVDDKWKKFENFLSDMGICPDKHSLDRVDNNKGYSKENCRWATNSQQHNNKRTNVRYTYMGETMTVSQWAKHFNICTSTLRNRLHRGKTFIESIKNAKVTGSTTHP